MLIVANVSNHTKNVLYLKLDLEATLQTARGRGVEVCDVIFVDQEQRDETLRKGELFYKIA